MLNTWSALTGIDVPHQLCKSKTVRAHFGLTPRRAESGGRRAQDLEAANASSRHRISLKLYPSARDPDVKYDREWSDGWSAGQPNREPDRQRKAREEWGHEESELRRTEKPRSGVSNGALAASSCRLFVFIR